MVLKEYIKTDWENTPSTNTPLSQRNLNKMEQGIYDNREALIELDDEVTNIDVDAVKDSTAQAYSAAESANTAASDANAAASNATAAAEAANTAAGSANTAAQKANNAASGASSAADKANSAASAANTAASRAYQFMTLSLK